MDESTLDALERLRAMGAVEVRIGDVHVRFEAPMPEPPSFPEMTEADLQRAHERLLYHSAL